MYLAMVPVVTHAWIPVHVFRVQAMEILIWVDALFHKVIHEAGFDFVFGCISVHVRRPLSQVGIEKIADKKGATFMI